MMPEGLPILFEHEAPDAPENSSLLDVPEPSDEEESLIKLCKHLFDKAKKNRGKYDYKWIDYYRMFRGDQWKQKRPSYRHSEVINFIFRHIQSTVPIMTDSRPKPNFLPEDPTDLEFSNVLNELFEADWQSGAWLYKVAEAIFNAHFYGTAYGNLKFDPDAEFGLGKIVFKCTDTFDIYPDPEATQVNEDEYSGYIVHVEARDVEKLRAKYADHPFLNAIKPDLMDFTMQDEKNKNFIRPQFQRLTDKKLPAESMATFSDDLLTDKVLVFTLYMKPTDIVEEVEEFTDPESGEARERFVTKKRYPKGRKVIMINNRIFEDGPLENDDGRFPYQKLVNYIDPNQFFGISEIEPLESPQLIFNKLVSFTLDVLTLMGNPIWLIPTASGVKPGSFHNAPGMQVPYDGQQPPTRVEGVQLQPYVIQMIDRMVGWFDDLSGSQDITRGVNPAGVTAAAAIENLQDAAQTRTRQKMRNLDAFLVDLGKQYVQLALQHYTAPRVFRLTNNQDEAKFFKFHVEPLREEKKDPMGQIVLDERGEPVYVDVLDDKGDPVRVGVIRNYKKDEDLGRLIEDTEAKRFLIRGSFDVKVNTASGLPFSKAEKEQRLLQLFDRGIVDAEEVLRQTEYPNYEAVLNRVKEQQAAMAQQQQGA